MHTRWIVRWWPLLYLPAWLVFSILAPEPFITGSNDHLAHVLASLGALSLILMAFKPDKQWVRFLGTIFTASYPLYRALSVAVENNDAISNTRRAVTVSFDLIPVISLLILYPMMMWVASGKRYDNGSE